MVETQSTEPPRSGGLSRLGLRQLWRRRPGAITAIEVDGAVLRLVQSAPKGGRMTVTHIAVEPLHWPAEADRSNPEVAGSLIARALDRMRLKPGAVIMAVPRALVMLRTLSIPVIEDVRELASAVHFQIGKDLPFRPEEAVIDFTISRKSGPGELPRSSPGGTESTTEIQNGAGSAPIKLEVLVAAVRREVVDFYRRTATAAGLKLASLGWQSYANAACLEACDVGGRDAGVALVSLRPEEVGVEVIAHRCLVHSRGTALKPADGQAPPTPGATEPAAQQPGSPAAAAESSAPSQPASMLDLVMIEVVRSLHSYGSMEQQIPVTRLLVTGSTGQETAVAEALQNRLNIPCLRFEPGQALNLPDPSRPLASGSISVLGLALSAPAGERWPFDFLNPRRPAVARNTRRIRIMLGTAAAVVLLVALASIRSHLVNQRLKTYREIQTELVAAEKKRPIYRQMTLQAATARDWLKENRNWLEHYAYLSAVLPSSEEIYVNSISVGSQGNIRLGVQARSGEILASLDKRLRAAGYDVKPLAITPGTDRHGFNFRSTVELAVPEKMKIDLAKYQVTARPADDGSLDPPSRTRREPAAEAPAKPRVSPPAAPPNPPKVETPVETPARPRWDGSGDNPKQGRRRGGPQ